MKKIISLFIAVLFTLGVAGIGLSAHKEEKVIVKGTITKIEATEYEITVKNDKGNETKVRVKDVGDVKTGDSAIIKDGKAAKQVKPLTGGY